MTEQDGFRMEAALECGFEMINDDGDVFRCTQAQVIDLMVRAETKARAEIASRSYAREKVYGVIDGERRYQDSLSPTSETDGHHTVPEFILYMEDYLAEARKHASRVWGPESKRLALDTLRKVITMGVACMEENGVVGRGE
jgi:hypothetical protein